MRKKKNILGHPKYNTNTINWDVYGQLSQNTLKEISVEWRSLWERNTARAISCKSI